MHRPAIAICLAVFLLSGCGLSYTRLPEIWDRIADPDAVYHMEAGVKNAIYCQLKLAADDIKQLGLIKRKVDGIDVATNEDQYFPDSWGILMQLTLQAEEKTALTPGVTFKSPPDFSWGIGGELSFDNTRSDKYNVYFSARDLNRTMPSGKGPCRDNIFGNDVPRSSSSPFLNAENLGIREWLVNAVKVINFERSSRESINGEGPPIQASGTASDSSTYDNKFIIVTDANVATTWSLVRIGTPAAPLVDAMRTRTHELIMTVGPGAKSFEVSKSTGRPTITEGPTRGAVDAFNAALIGSAVSNALRPAQ